MTLHVQNTLENVWLGHIDEDDDHDHDDGGGGGGTRDNLHLRVIDP